MHFDLTLVHPPAIHHNWCPNCFVLFWSFWSIISPPTVHTQTLCWWKLRQLCFFPVKALPLVIATSFRNYRMEYNSVAHDFQSSRKREHISLYLSLALSTCLRCGTYLFNAIYVLIAAPDWSWFSPEKGKEQGISQMNSIHTEVRETENEQQCGSLTSQQEI